MKKCVIVILVLFVSIFSGCSDNSGQVKLVDTLDKIEGMGNYVPTGTLAQSFSKNVYYEVSDIAWEDNVGVAKVKISTPDLAQLIADGIQQAIDEYGTEDYDALLKKAKENIQTILDSPDYPVSENTIEMKAEKTKDGYLLVSNEEFERIISGNPEKVFINALMEGIADESKN